MTNDSPNQTLLPCREESKQCAASPISEIPLKGYYGGKPKRISIEYDDYSSQHIGNADGSVDLIFAKLEQLYSTRTPDNSIEARTNIIAKSLRNWLSPEFFSEADIHKIAVGMNKAISEEDTWKK